MKKAKIFLALLLAVSLTSLSLSCSSHSNDGISEGSYSPLPPAPSK